MHVVEEEEVVLDQLELADAGDPTFEEEDPRADQDVMVDDLAATAYDSTEGDVLGDLGLTEDPFSTDASYLAADD
jgi:hypothetical protein